MVELYSVSVANLNLVKLSILLNENNKKQMVANLIAEGKEVERFKFLLDTFLLGRPEMVGFGLGIERLLAAWIGNGTMAADFAFYPRYETNVTP